MATLIRGGTVVNADRAFRAGPGQVGKIDVGNGQRFDILAGLGSDAVTGEREIAGRKDAGLGVLHVHVLDVRQIACVAREHDIALVFDRTRLAAIAWCSPGSLMKRASMPTAKARSGRVPGSVWK